jgi:hypothetical protein
MQLGTLRKKVGEYQRQTAKHGTLSSIATLGPWTRDDRTSPRLKGLSIARDGSYTVDLMFLPIDGARVAPGARDAVTRLVQADGTLISGRAGAPRGGHVDRPRDRARHTIDLSARSRGDS